MEVYNRSPALQTGKSEETTAKGLLGKNERSKGVGNLSRRIGLRSQEDSTSGGSKNEGDSGKEGEWQPSREGKRRKVGFFIRRDWNTGKMIDTYFVDRDPCLKTGSSKLKGKLLKGVPLAELDHWQVSESRKARRLEKRGGWND